MNIDALLDDNEKIVWREKPDRNVYAFRGIVISVFGLFWLLMSCSFTFPFGLIAPFMAITSIPFVLIGLAMVLNPLYNYLAWKDVEYAITDKRVIMSSGLIGKDFKSVDFDKIQNISVNVGLIDKLFGNNNTGSIKVFSGEVGRSKNGVYSVSDTMFGVKNPYDVYKKIKKVSHDIKTDIEYPNKLRPGENPGYETKYTPEEDKE